MLPDNLHISDEDYIKFFEIIIELTKNNKLEWIPSSITLYTGKTFFACKYKELNLLYNASDQYLYINGLIPYLKYAHDGVYNARIKLYKSIIEQIKENHKETYARIQEVINESRT